MKSGYDASRKYIIVKFGTNQGWLHEFNFDNPRISRKVTFPSNGELRSAVQSQIDNLQIQQ